MPNEIWYNIVWEPVKDADYVIDYNIREEQTKDAFAEKNANNQTTTGMANVIPWVNSPKLLLDTSIIWTKIVNISNYQSVDEWQNVVNKVIWWEHLCVLCKFTAYSNTIFFYFTPCSYTPSQSITFVAINPRSKWLSITCNLSWTTITSVTTSNWTP